MASYDDIMRGARKTLAQPNLVTPAPKPVAKKLPAPAIPKPAAKMSRSAAAMKERVTTEQEYGIGRRAQGIFGTRDYSKQ